LQGSSSEFGACQLKGKSVSIQLVENLQDFSSEDETIREILNRKSRVEIAQTRVSEVSGGKMGYLDTRTSTTRR
jgi:hypothetical protein